jgi:hypothetical protein
VSAATRTPGQSLKRGTSVAGTYIAKRYVEDGNVDREE